MTIQLVVADGHPLILEGLQQVIQQQPDMEVVAQCAHSDGVGRALQQHRPNILIIDIHNLPGDVMLMLESMKAEELPTRVVVLTDNLDVDEPLEGLRLGVRGVVLKTMPPRLLLQCVRKVAAGGVWLENQSVMRYLRHTLTVDEVLQSAGHQVLTPREEQIIRGVAAGRSNKCIARTLDICEGTVKIHLHHIYQKLDLHGRMELMLFAREHGIC